MTQAVGIVAFLVIVAVLFVGTAVIAGAWLAVVLETLRVVGS